MPHAYGWTDWSNDDYERQRDAWHDNVLYPRDELALVRELAADGIIPPIADGASRVLDAEWGADESAWDCDYDRYAGSCARQHIELAYASPYTYTDDDGNDTPVICYVELVWDLEDGSVRNVNFRYDTE